MSTYIDGFVFPIRRAHLEEYAAVAKKVAHVWQEYGALAYHEYLGDELQLEGTRSFLDLVEAKADEVVIFGWMIFPSKAVRDLAFQQVSTDPRMKAQEGPLMDPTKRIFDASRMFFGGFQPLLQVGSNGDN